MRAEEENSSQSRSQNKNTYGINERRVLTITVLANAFIVNVRTNGLIPIQFKYTIDFRLI